MCETERGGGRMRERERGWRVSEIKRGGVRMRERGGVRMRERRGKGGCERDREGEVG